MAGSDQKPWWRTPKNQAHADIQTYIQAVEKRHFKHFDKFRKLEAMYDPNSIRADKPPGEMGIVDENVIAQNVDTVHAAIAATDVRARFMTDDANWSEQKRARQLEWYAEGIGKLLDVDEKCRMAFKNAALKGSGFVHVYADRFDQIRVEHVPVDEIVVDEAEIHNGMPAQLHRRRMVDREELKALYPGFDDEIDDAQTTSSGRWKLWAGYRPVEQNDVVVTESWRLPIGVEGRRGYRAGRHVVAIDGTTLLDEKWKKPFYPLARIVWCEPPSGWYGISLGERIAGHQRVINRMNWQVDRALQQWAVPVRFVRPSDIGLAVKAVNAAGAIVPVRGEMPKTEIPPAVSGEVYNRLERVKSGAFEESGVSRLAAQSVKPAGVDSGVALREYRDQTTQRFSIQEKAFETLKLDVVVLILDVCHDLGDAAPRIMRRTRFSTKKIAWKQVYREDVKIQIAAASTISRTPAGRMQTVLEWAQAGIVSQDEARRLLRHPDLEKAMSLYVAALENVEYGLEEIEEGRVMVPEPFMNLKMIVWRGQMRLLELSTLPDVPEDILEAMRQFVVQAAWMIAQPANAQQDNAAAGMQPAADAAANANGAPGAMPPGAGAGMPPLPGGPPPNGPAPQAALAPQAMQLVAG